MRTLARGGNARLHRLFAIVNFGWAIWALIGGVYFLTQGDAFERDPSWSVFNSHLHGYQAVGISLLTCAVLSFLASAFHRLRRMAAIVCAVWCGVVALILQCATPEFDQGDVYAWLLLMCSFTCACRWALLVLEPHVCE